MTVRIIRAQARQSIIRSTEAAVIVRPNLTRIIRDGVGPRGRDAKVCAGFFVTGPFSARQLICAIKVSGSGVLAAVNSHARALGPCAAQNVWSVTLNGTYAGIAAATPVATPAEIAANLFATITFPAGASDAAWAYPTGGAVADNDLLYVWESGTPDATQASTTVTLAGA